MATFVERPEPFSGLHNKTNRETPRASLKKNEKWSRRRCDNEIVTVLSKGQIAILKMAAVQSYLLTDQNRFRGGHI